MMKHGNLLRATSVLFVFAVLFCIQDGYANELQQTNSEFWDKRFGKLGIHGSVFAIAEDHQGNIYLGGDFELVNDGSRNLNVRNIVKWDGETFRSPGGGVNGTVNAISIDENGAVFVGGSFARAYQDDVNYVRTNNIARWDGTYWYPLGQLDAQNNGVNQAVEDIHFMDGTMYIAGSFTRANQPDGTTLTANYIAGWNGSSWFALGDGMDSRVLTLTSKGHTLYAGGVFKKAGNANASAIARWNGSEWSALEVDPGSGVTVNALIFGPDENLYAGGSFMMIGGITAFHIAMWDEAKWVALDMGTASLIGMVYALEADSSHVYIGGTSFNNLGETSVNHMARWDGSTWSGLGGGIQGGQWGQPVSVVKTISMIRGDLYAGGIFSIAGDVSAQNIARWDGFKWHPLGLGGNLGPDYIVDAIGIANHGVYVGGAFNSVGHHVIPYLARWDGSAWHEVGGGVTDNVSAITVHGDNVYVGGTFARAGGQTVNRIAMWDGLSWHALGGGVNGRVAAIAVDDNGNVYAGGEFSRATNPDQTTVTVNHIAKWDGEQWHSLDQGTSDHVYALAVRDNDLFAGGRFRSASGQTVNFIARWDGAEWHDLAGGTNLTVTSLAVDHRGQLYAGGIFHSAGPTFALNIARWDGNVWHDVDGGFDGPMITALATDNDMLYAGGNFNNAGSITTNSIAKLERGRWSPMGQGVTMPGGAGMVNAIAAKDRQVYLGGLFLEAGGQPSNFFGSWTEPDTGHFDLLTFTQAPGRGIAVPVGSDVLLRWNHIPQVNEVKLEIRYGVLNVPWIEIAVLPADTGEYLLSLPHQEYDHVFLRISDTDAPDIHDTSGPFSIYTEENISSRLRIPLENGTSRLFHREIDGWSFLNSEANLWPFDEPFPDWDTFCAALTDNFCYTSLGTRRISAKTTWRIMQEFGWQGSCSGFAITSLLFFNYHLFVPMEFPDYDYLHQVGINHVARKMINATQIRFLLPVASDFFRHYIDKWNNTPMEALEAIEASLDQYRNHLSLVIMDPNSRKSVHTIQPFRIVRDPVENKATIFSYDSNHPRDPHYYRTTELTVDLNDNTWTYTFSPYNVKNATGGMFNSPNLEYFINLPEILRGYEFPPDDQLLARSHEHHLLDDPMQTHMFVYTSPHSGIILENRDAQQIGRLLHGDLIHSIPESVPLLPPVGDYEPELPLGYFVPVDNYSINQQHYDDAGSHISLFRNGALFQYQNLSPVVHQTDRIYLHDGFSVVNTNPTEMNIAFEVINRDEQVERQFLIRNLGVSQGDSLRVALAGNHSLQFLNSGSEKQYELEIVNQPEHQKSGIVVFRDIAIPANARHKLVPDWEALAVEPMIILIDRNMDGVFEDSIRVYGEYSTDATEETLDPVELPADYALYQNYPNPFNAATVIRYRLPEASPVRLEVFNTLGQRVARLQEETRHAGFHEVLFDASHLPSGVYIYRLQAGDFVKSRKLLLIK